MALERVVVFGHYDSRGGATGVVVPEFSEEAVEEARKNYDDVFAPDAEMMAGWIRPSSEDFLFLGVIEIPAGVDRDADFEQDDEGRYALVIDEGADKTGLPFRKLEVIILPQGMMDDLERKREAIWTKMAKVGVAYGWSAHWTPEQQEIATALMKEMDDLDAANAADICALATYAGPGAQMASLGEDGFGFVLQD